MSLLIQLRDRIKGIDTIKKITHAMRLISMSSRSRLKSKEEPLQEYINQLTRLFYHLKEQAPTWKNSLIIPPANIPPNKLVILIGSQRGLCGNFNAMLFRFFENSILHAPTMKGSIQIIPIGKKAVNYIDDNPLFTIVAQYPELNAKNISAIAHEIIALLTTQEKQFTQVTVVSNILKTFFVQKPKQTTLIPLHVENEVINSSFKDEDYYWEHDPLLMLDQLSYQILEIYLQYLLFESLLAEHAARFISMDNATRNAKSLLEETQLQYNKLRQAKITKELTELVSNI